MKLINIVYGDSEGPEELEIPLELAQNLSIGDSDAIAEIIDYFEKQGLDLVDFEVEQETRNDNIKSYDRAIFLMHKNCD